MTRALSLRQLASIGATLWLVSPSTLGQSDTETLANLRACGSVTRDAARLACFDRALAAEQAAAATVVTTDRTVATVPVVAGRPTTSNTRPPGAAPTPMDTLPADDGRGETRAGRAAAAPAASAAGATGAVRNGSGASQTSAAEPPGRITIVDVNDDLPGAARFTADSGRVFVQTSGGTPRGGYPDVPFEARIGDGAFGSLFLYVSARRRVRGVWVD